MIRREGEYLVADEPYSPASDSRVVEHVKQPEVLYGQGSTKDRLALIRREINCLKQEKEARGKFLADEQAFLNKCRDAPTSTPEALTFRLQTPEYLFKLISRVEDLESRVGRAELYNQTVHRKGNLVERVRALQMKITKLSELPIETISKNIQNFNALTEDREEHFKYLMLYDQFMKTHGTEFVIAGLKEDYRTVRTYLENLKVLHEEGSTIPSSMIRLLAIHNDVLAKCGRTEQQMEELYRRLTLDYKQLSDQLDQLESL